MTTCNQIFNFAENKNKTFIVGTYRSDKEHLSWILGIKPERRNKFYNVRYKENLFSSRCGCITDKSIPDYVLIYDYKNLSSGWHLFPCITNRIVSEQDMYHMQYPKPNGAYVLYQLGDEIICPQIDLSQLLFSNKNAAQTKFEPMLVYGSEIANIECEEKKYSIPFNDGVLRKKFTHIDCFAGPGGICTGLHAAGFETLVAIEYVKSCCETYTANHPEVHMIHSDIRNVKDIDILPFIPKDGVDLVTSGMPCETFSMAGTTSRSFYDDRQFLFREGIRMAKIANAKFILFENVPGITSKTVAEKDKTLIIDVLKKELIEAGYSNFIETKLLATDFGVPQKRQRFFILATRFPSCRLSIPTASCKRLVTVEDAFAGLPNVVANSDIEANSYTEQNSDYAALMRSTAFWKREGYEDRLTYQIPMRHKNCTLKRFALIKPGEGLKNLFERLSESTITELQKDGTLPKKIFSKRNIRLELDKPALTITSHCLDENLHPTQDRALTVRECARLQSFPDSYDFCGGPFMVGHDNRNVQDKYEQIGDAVPPLLAFAWGKHISSLLNKNDLRL